MEVRQRRCKLVCTLGPASSGVDGVRALADAGADVFRINFSHGDAATHEALVAAVREVDEERETDLAVLVDLPGPKIRLGRLAQEPMELRAQQAFVLDPDVAVGDELHATTTYPDIAGDLRAGDRILLADGAVELLVRAIDGRAVACDVVRGGRVRSGAGVNVPAERLGLPAITERDREGLARALDLKVDLVAQSFVRTADDIDELRVLMGHRAVPIVAKIETRPAIEDADAILEEADAIMVARGDLGVELPIEEIPVLQKRLLRAAREAGRPAIVATQMLESMVHAPRPTRAEATDVANAVLEGADAIMLSAETAIGEYPIEAARAAVRIAEVAEANVALGTAPAVVPRDDEAHGVAAAASRLAAQLAGVTAIACYTATGRTAGLLAAERPGVPIVAFVPDRGIRRALALRWGVVTRSIEVPVDTDRMIAAMDAELRATGLCERGGHVVMVGSMPAGRTTTNMLKVHEVGEDPV
ncbi:MAG: pyruvate kinase [Actinomycetota bacterium]